jgi:hypothetical protein
VEPVRGRQPSDLSVEKAVPVKEHRGQHKEIGNGQNPQKYLGRGGAAIEIGEPAIEQRHEGRAHVLHGHRRDGSLHRGSGQLQQIAHILHQSSAHNENQELLFPGPLSVEQENQRDKSQADAKALQRDDHVYHIDPPLRFHAHIRQSLKIKSRFTPFIS